MFEFPLQRHPHPEVWLLMVGIFALYLGALRWWGPHHVSSGERPASYRQVACFAAGLVLLIVGATWPIHELAERYLFSVHMSQHFIFSLMAPPLLLLGTPSWLARRLLRPRPVFAAMKVLTRPLLAMAIFNVFFVFSHWPTFVEFTLKFQLAHFFAHFALVATALLMWWPVLSPLPEFARISNPAQLLYLFGQTILPTVPASFLTFSETTFYKTYAEAPRILSGITALSDQRIAGVVMKLGGGALLWTVITVLFFRWSSNEEKGTVDAIDWQNLERSVNRTGSVR
ncbi:MAG: cytochrome c oxidase assembly protein [Actinomycetota bacterium]